MADEPQTPGTIIVNPQAAFEESKTSPTSSDTTKSLSAPQLQEQADSAALTKDEIAGTAPRAALDTANAQIEADAARNKEAIGAKTLAEKTAVDEKQMANIAAKAEVLRQAQEAIKATPAPQLFASRDGWGKARLAIGLALAGLGDAIGARASAVLHEQRGPSAVSDIISMDLDRQKANLQKLTDQQIMAKEGVKDAIQARELALAKVDMKGAALLNLAAQHAEALLKAKGVEAPAIAQNELILKLRRDEEQRKAQAVAGLTNEHTKNSGKTETTTRVGSTTPPSPNTTPTHIADQLTDTDLPVDPTATDSKQHNAATAKLAPVNTFLDTSSKLIREAMKNGPARNETVAGVTNGDTTQADRNAAVTRLRSAYAAAKGESVSEANSKQLEQAIPNPPSSMSPKGQWDAWLAKMHEVTGEMNQLRTEYLTNAGVPREEIKKANAKLRAKFLQGEQAPAPTPATAGQGQTQPMVPPAAPTAPVAPRAPVPRANLTEGQSALFRWAVSHPNDPRSPQIISNLGAR